MKIYKYIFIFIVFYGYSQNVDSLERALPSLKGKIKAKAYLQCIYPLVFTDVNKALRYGYYAWDIYKNDPPDSLEFAMLLNDLSIAYAMMGQVDSSIILNKIAFGIRIRAKQWRDAGASASKIGMMLIEKNKNWEALQWQLRAMELFRKSNARVELAKTLNNIGRCYQNNLQYPEAMNFYYESASQCWALGDTLGYINSRANVAVCYDNFRKFDSVEFIYQQIYPYAVRMNNTEMIAQIYQNLGVMEINRGNNQKSLEYYIKALPYYEKISNLTGIASLCTNIGNGYLREKQPQKALPYYERALDAARKSNSWQWLKHAYNGLKEYYLQTGKYDKAIEFDHQADLYNDSIYNEENQKIVLQLQAEYDLKEKENQILMKDISLQQKENALQKRNRNIILLSSLLAILLLGILLLIMKRKSERQAYALQMHQEILRERSRIARDLHDNLGSELTLATTLSDKNSYLTDNTDERKKWSELSEQIRKANLTMRDTIWAIHDETIQLNNMIKRISDYALRVCETAEIQLQTQGFGDIPTIPIKPEIALNIYRACQEIIQNSIKHSGTKQLRLEWHKEGKLSLSDRGKGFNKNEALQNNSSYGLKNIQKRLHEAQVEYDINTSDSGT